MQLSAASDLILVGASVRAAARSALLGGLRPIGVDLFADADLVAQCPTFSIGDLATDCVPAFRNLPALPWAYAGGLENLPDVVEQLSATRPLWGVEARSLRAVRNPYNVETALQAVGCRMPSMVTFPDLAPADGSWLVKKCQSSAGLGVAVWRGGEKPEHYTHQDGASPLLRTGRYFQQWLDGPSTSAVFVASGGRAVFRGSARQYTGRFGAGPFNYCGSVGPLRLSPERRAEWQLIGATLAREFGLTGVFGVDAIVHQQRLYVVDVNPRWPASAELYDEAYPGTSLMGQHVAACRDGRLPAAPPDEPTLYVGKAVLYADRPLEIDRETTSWLLSHSTGDQPRAADVPRSGTTIGPGEPICTMFGRGATLNQASHRLVDAVKRTRRWIDARQQAIAEAREGSAS